MVHHPRLSDCYVGFHLGGDALTRVELTPYAICSSNTEQGEWLAYIHLARLYRYGRGTAVNEQATLEWYEAAVSESETIAPCPELDEAREYVALH